MRRICALIGLCKRKILVINAGRPQFITLELFGPSVSSGPGRRKSIALTFDDGPSEGTLELPAYTAAYIEF